MAQSLPPPSGTRSRQSSSASMNRYTPQNYENGPPPSRPSAEGPGYGRPRGPSIENQQIPSIPPSPNLYPGQPPGMQAPQRERKYSNERYQRPPYPSEGPSGSLRPPMEGRRESAASNHSRRSHDSHRSQRSNHSQRSRSGRHSYSSDDRDRRSYDRPRAKNDHRSYDRGREDGGRDPRPLKRVKTHRPTWGDTIYGIFGAIKTSLSGSDK